MHIVPESAAAIGLGPFPHIADHAEQAVRAGARRMRTGRRCVTHMRATAWCPVADATCVRHHSAPPTSTRRHAVSHVRHRAMPSRPSGVVRQPPRTPRRTRPLQSPRRHAPDRHGTNSGPLRRAIWVIASSTELKPYTARSNSSSATVSMACQAGCAGTARNSGT